MQLRPVKLDDIELIFKWANDPLARANSINTELIKWENHVEWFNKKLNSPNETQIFIALNKFKNPIGQIRFDREDSKGIVAYYISEDSRGKGFGKDLLQVGCEKIFDVWGDLIEVIGVVKKENIPSIKAFEKANFVLSETNFDYLTFSTFKK